MQQLRPAPPFVVYLPSRCGGIPQITAALHAQNAVTPGLPGLSALLQCATQALRSLHSFLVKTDQPV